MATVKVKFRASSVAMKEGALFYQVIHNRVARQVPAGYRLFPDEWDAARAEIVVPSDVEESRRSYLLVLEKGLKGDVARLKGIIDRLDRSEPAYTADRVAELFRAPAECREFVAFARNLVRQLEQIGRKRIAETYTTALNSFERFRGNENTLLEEVDADLMMRYEAYMKSAGICPNSTSFYMRNLRAIYNRAVDKGFTLQRNPFRHVYTGIDKTVKRAVPLRVIRQIRDLDLNPPLDYARDLFMFSFYTRGMSFVDMAYLKKKDLRNGILSYRRQKTGQQLLIKWERPMQEIVEKYDTSDTPYLLPIIRSAETDDRRQYLNAAHLVNARLRKLGERLGLGIPLTSYVARHAWASIARSKNIPLSIISEAMGHDSENTTRIYLASLDTSVVDRANRLIIKSL